MTLINKIRFNVFRGYAHSLYQFLILVFAIKMFGRAHWGEIVGIFLITNLLSMVAQFGQKEYLLRAFSKSPSEISILFSKNFVSRSLFLLFGLLFFLFYPPQIASMLIVLVVLQYLYLSMDCLVVYFQKFKAQFIAESVCFAIILGGFLLLKEFHLQSAIAIYSIAFGLRFFILTLFIKPTQFIKQTIFSWDTLKKGFPFFLLAFSGWLTARLDTYFVSYYLTNTELGVYQFLISGLLLIQSLSYFISLPLYKYYFRLNTLSSKAIQKKFITYALPLALIAFSCFMVFEKVVFDFGFTFWTYLWALLFIIPTFFYTFDVLTLFKNNKEYSVVAVNGTMLVLQSIIFVLLIPKLQFNGALVTVCAAQWIALIIYKRFNFKSV